MNRPVNRYLIIFWMFVMLDFVYVLPAAGLDLSGAMVVDWFDRRMDKAPMPPGSPQQSWRFVQTNINFSQRITDDIRTYFELTFTPDMEGVGEAWTRFENLPNFGQLTVGKFRLPDGAPLLTAGLSLPALIYHTPLVTGAKLSMEKGLWFGEVGLVYMNPISAAGTQIGGFPALARPYARPLVTGSDRDIYGHLCYRNGGKWGSVSLSSTYLYGEMSDNDRTTIRNLNGFNQNQIVNRRRDIFNLSGDYTYGPVRLFAELVRAKEAELHLKAMNFGAAYRWRDFEFMIGKDYLDNNFNLKPATIPATWERERSLYSISYFISENAQLQAVYESNFDRADFAPAVEGDPENDLIVIQLVVGF